MFRGLLKILKNKTKKKKKKKQKEQKKNFHLVYSFNAAPGNVPPQAGACLVDA